MKALLKALFPAAVLGVLVASMPAGSANATLPGGNGKIAYVHNSTTDLGCIWTTNADGSNQQPFFCQNRDDGDLPNEGAPAWSPDGTQIAFRGNPFSHCIFATHASLGIYALNADGSGLRKVADTCDTAPSSDPNASGLNSDPSWSPDGATIAFATTFGEDHIHCACADHWQIAVVSADGSAAGLDSLTPDLPGASTNPKWSPDGSRIVFQNIPGVNVQHHDIWIMNADGTGLTRLTNDGVNGLENVDPDWSPDGSKIVFSSNRNDGIYDLYTMSPDGSNVTRLTNYATRDSWQLDPSWSPDGARIAFASNMDDPNFDIYTVNAADGSDLQRVTNTPNTDREPNWQPLPSNDVVVTNCSDPSLAGLTSVQGNLVVDNVQGCTSVSLPNLQHVGGTLDISNDSSLTSVDAPTLDSVGGSIDIENDPTLGTVDVGSVTTTGGSVNIRNDTVTGTVDLGALTTAASVDVSNDTSASTIDLSALVAVTGSVTVSNDTSASTINLGSLTTAGDVTITNNNAATDVEVAPDATVSGNLTLATTGPVSAQTAGGKTDITVLGGTAAMHVVVPKGAFDQPVAFTITGTGDTPPEQGTTAGGAPALIDPVAGDLFTFAIPTLNQDADLTFTVDLSNLDAVTRAALVQGVQSGSATIAVKGDAQGSAYQAFARCSAGQTPQTDGCVDAVLLDASGQPTQLAAAAAFARFDGIAGHFSTYSVALVTPEGDNAPPAVTITLPTPNGDNGWFRTGPVKGTVTADDSKTGGSNISSIDCGSLPLATTGLGTPTANGTFAISTEGVTHISCTAKDSAGNASQPVTADVKLDTQAPTLTASIGPTPILLHGSASATPNAGDATSGVAAQSCGSVGTASAGVHTVDCTARDNAGNTTTITVSYLVEYKILGFFSPVPQSKWKAGQTVPVKFALADANGVRIPDAEAQGLLSPACRVTFGVTGAQTVSNACVKYDAGSHQFAYEWKLGKQTGNATITVAVTYPGTAAKTTLSEPITITA